ncbi:hypothetical protein CC86DRAFT_384133 [Ophiobolus disseminans]|uniref:2EXR domain-containing protein n=1 Tax=Ophiobolus disseminans TaxID=1469910 RepID=A0A6A6ZVA1_9PLEO|nr:hypothetical protein CC86DRAFT_384133 [Ophiobolus disseminans]
MPAPPHLPIFNKRFDGICHSFLPFSCLPKELRLQVWRYALLRPRIIKIYLFPSNLNDTTAMRSYLNDPRGWQNNTGHYTVVMSGAHVLSVFLRVCRDSRAATLAHFRVHIPCTYLQPQNDAHVYSVLMRAMSGTCSKDVPRLETFHFNPEWDHLRIVCWPKATALLPPFLHDLKTQYDPSGIGLLKLVVSYDDNAGCGNITNLEPPNVPSAFAKSVTQTFNQLEEVFFYESLSAGRVNLTHVWGITWDWFFNRSLPLKIGIPAFDRFPTDPRPISKDLQKQYMGTRDWHGRFQAYLRVLSRFSDSSEPLATSFKIMISHVAGLSSEGGRELESSNDAEKWLRADYERWWVDRSGWPPTNGQPVFENEQYIMEAEPAFGFWLFPLEAAEMIASIGDPDQRVFDMRVCTPELGLAIMSRDSTPVTK